tara:strand:+ start:301 stop:558 length:258 start_codon:yes stop_codon:yes gene_type:complete
MRSKIEYNMGMSYEEQRQAAMSLYSDLYKEVHGVRPRWNYGFTLEQFDTAIQALDCEIQDLILDKALGWKRYAPISTFTNSPKFS